jgi:hypothetical protein
MLFSFYFHFLKYNKIIRLTLKASFFELVSRGFLYFHLSFLVIIKLTKKKFSILINIKYYVKIKSD